VAVASLATTAIFSACRAHGAQADDAGGLLHAQAFTCVFGVVAVQHRDEVGAVHEHRRFVSTARRCSCRSCDPHPDRERRDALVLHERRGGVVWVDSGFDAHRNTFARLRARISWRSRVTCRQAARVTPFSGFSGEALAHRAAPASLLRPIDALLPLASFRSFVVGLLGHRGPRRRSDGGAGSGPREDRSAQAGVNVARGGGSGGGAPRGRMRSPGLAGPRPCRCAPR
jgi:hypothetical protein